MKGFWQKSKVSDKHLLKATAVGGYSQSDKKARQDAPPPAPPPAPSLAPSPASSPALSPQNSTKCAREIGGPRGAEPTRYGDWERGGRCIDF